MQRKKAPELKKKGKRNEFYETTPLRRAGFECR